MHGERPPVPHQPETAASAGKAAAATARPVPGGPAGILPPEAAVTASCGSLNARENGKPVFSPDACLGTSAKEACLFGSTRESWRWW